MISALGNMWFVIFMLGFCAIQVIFICVDAIIENILKRKEEKHYAKERKNRRKDRKQGIR